MCPSGTSFLQNSPGLGQGRIVGYIFVIRIANKKQRVAGDIQRGGIGYAEVIVHIIEPDGRPAMDRRRGVFQTRTVAAENASGIVAVARQVCPGCDRIAVV